MDDLISRQIAIDGVIKSCFGESNVVIAEAKAINYIKKIPSAKPKTKCIAQIKVDPEEIVRRIKEEYEIVDEWIPCSERLPDERQDVYVTVLWDDYGDYVTAYGMRTKFGWYLHSNAEGELIKGYTVVAWMPLPKPYEGGEDE